MNALKKRFSKVMLVTILSSLLLSACNPVSDRPGDIVTDTPDFIVTDEKADTAIFHLMLLKKKFIIP